MPDFSIFVLGESQITVSGGGQLSGITQGDGSHLVGLTITLDSRAWTEVLIKDNDSDFSDNDGNQRLDGRQTIDGTSYANNTVVEAEFGLTLSDGVNTWQVVGFNANNSSPSYATIEGLAFVGGPGGFPPDGVALTVVSAQEFPTFSSTSYATPICYDKGALILTDRGLRPVETLRAGDRVQTADNGLRPIRWIDGRHGIAAGRFAPVEIAAGILGAQTSLRVSQQHRILVQGPQAELMFGEAEVFVPAIHLVDGHGIRLIERGRVQYFHLLLDEHDVVFANGVASESLHVAGSQEPTRTLETQFFPELKSFSGLASPLARRCLKRHEAALLCSRHAAIDQRPALRHSA
jgi:hypothetical protein